MITAALIGAGQIARQHLSCLQQLGGVHVAAVCDRSPSVAESAAARFGIPAWFTDHGAMLDGIRPDVVHVTTPPSSHYPLAMDALASGAHVVVEKPATTRFADVEALLGRARHLNRAVIEDHNYVFNSGTRQIIQRIESGAFGAVVHVEVMICLDIVKADGFADPNAPHPSLSLAGGAIADFLPHLASLAHAFVGPHCRARTSWTRRKKSVLPFDEFRAVVEAKRGTASLVFSGTSQPDAFWLRVYGERTTAATNLFETRLTFDSVRPGPRPLQTLRNGLEEGAAVRRAAVRTLARKFRGGAGAYEGLYELIGRTYRALADRSRLPVTSQQVLEVNRLVADLKPKDSER